jgi:hypothetical protein
MLPAAPPAVRLPRQRQWSAGSLLFILGMLAPTPAQPQSTQTPQTAPLPEGTPRSWAESVVRNEVAIVESEGKLPVRYRQRKVDAKGDTTREIIETRDGNVARLVERNGQPITAADDAAERDRLNAEIADPEAFIKHHKRDNTTRDDIKALVKMLPDAMIYTFVPGQPQRPGVESREVVIDFHPDPKFHPPTMEADLLTGVEGRAWIDARSHCLTRVDARVLHPVNFGFGVVAKIFAGGTVAFEQTRAFGDRWAYSHMEEHLTARVLLVKTLPENTVITSSDFRPMPSLMPYQDAIRMLLAMQIPLR